MIESLFISLLLTILIELDTSVIIGIRNTEDLKTVFWANVLTNPIVVYIANCVNLLNNTIIYNIVIIIMEILAVIVEYIIFKKLFKYKKKSPLFISFLNNAISFSLGIFISFFI